MRKRPGMYTDTTRPNHLAQEVIDNSVDEALAGYATELKVLLYPDNSLEVTDNGRGMPVDIHPKHKVSGVELILTRLHAGGKFSNKNYQFSGGLHGVGVSVVNALSNQLDLTDSSWRTGLQHWFWRWLQDPRARSDRYLRQAQHRYFRTLLAQCQVF